MPTPPKRIMRGGALLLAAALAGPVPAQDAPPADVPTTSQTIGQARSLLDQWVEVRQLIMKERADWAEAKAFKEGRVALMKRNIEDIRKQIDEKQLELEKFNAQITELAAKDQQLKDSAERVEQFITVVEARTLDLLKGMPEPLVKQTAPFAGQIVVADADADAAATPGEGQVQEAKKQDLSMRVGNATNILILVNKFAGKIVDEEDILTQADGVPMKVRVLYLGVSLGFYADDEGTTGAIGTAGPTGWVWTSVDAQTAAQIRKAIAVYDKDQPAQYISLPVEVK